MKHWVTKSGQKIFQVLEERSNSFLISWGGKYLLVDTGREASREKLREALDKLGASDSSLAALVLTHSHYDHAENAAYIKEKYKTRIILHKDEAGYLNKGENPLIQGTNFVIKLMTDLFAEKVFARRRYQPAECDILVDEKYDLSDWGFNAYLLHTPGHTPGSMSVIIDGEIALVGDAMFGIFKRSAMPPYAENKKLLVESWEKLLSTGCSVFLPSHGTTRSKDLLQRQYEKCKRKYHL